MLGSHLVRQLTSTSLCCRMPETQSPDVSVLRQCVKEVVLQGRAFQVSLNTMDYDCNNAGCCCVTSVCQRQVITDTSSVHVPQMAGEMTHMPVTSNTEDGGGGCRRCQLAGAWVTRRPWAVHSIAKLQSPKVMLNWQAGQHKTTFQAYHSAIH